MAELTVLWNQACPPVTSSYWAPYSSSGSSAVFSNGVCTMTWKTASGGYWNSMKLNNFRTYSRNDVLYFSYQVRPDPKRSNQVFGMELNNEVVDQSGKICPPQRWTRVSCIKKITVTLSAYPPLVCDLREGTYAIGDSCQFRYPIIVNLTKMYGAGKEPKTPEEFEYHCSVNGVDLNQYIEIDAGTERTWIIPESLTLLLEKHRALCESYESTYLGQAEYCGLPVLINNSYLKYHNSYIGENVGHDTNYFITGWFDTETTDSKSYTVKCISAENSYCKFFNNKKKPSTDYYGISNVNNGNTRLERTFTASGRYIACTVYKPEAGDFFIYDNTNNRYICKGENVT